MNLVKCERKDRILEISLNRPEKKNAVNAAMLQVLGDFCERFHKDPEVRVVLLRGEGGSFLCRCGSRRGQYLRRRGSEAVP